MGAPAKRSAAAPVEYKYEVELDEDASIIEITCDGHLNLEKIDADSIMCNWVHSVEDDIRIHGELKFVEDKLSDRGKRYLPQANVLDGCEYQAVSLPHLLSIDFSNTGHHTHTLTHTHTHTHTHT